MNIELIRNFCLKLKGVVEDYPFNEETLTFKVMGKIFLLASLEKIPLQINLKCDPEKAIELREQYDCIQPGFHMNKTHWNTMLLDGSLNYKFIEELIKHSYDLVVSGLKTADKVKLENL